MTNVLIFQPFCSNNHKHLSDTIERQFRFIKYNKDMTPYVLFDLSEQEMAQKLSKHSWLNTIVIDLHNSDYEKVIEDLQKTYNFSVVFVSRTYFTPYTREHKYTLKNTVWEDKADIKYIRDYIPVKFSKLGAFVHHIVYDPLELNYMGIIKNYEMWSSMNNVPMAKPHNFADLGYFDKNMEIPLDQKDLLFTFGGTSLSEDRSKMLEDLDEKFRDMIDCSVFIKTKNKNTTISNDEYEPMVARSLFTYTIPSQNPAYVSFTRMLLALSQGTIPLAHQDNNFDCLLGVEFEFRKGLEEFFKLITFSPDELVEFFNKPRNKILDFYNECLQVWHNSGYYNWLMEDK